MLCPKCGSDDVDLIQKTKRREHWYCYHHGFHKDTGGFYVKPTKRLRKRSARRTGKKGG